jgi:uncharacterized protein
LALAHEHDPDPEMRPYKEPITAEAREKLIVGAAAGVTGRLVENHLFGKAATVRRVTPKIGRNDPCPSGPASIARAACPAATAAATATTPATTFACVPDDL